MSMREGMWTDQQRPEREAANAGEAGTWRKHPTAEVSYLAQIEADVVVWAWSHVRENAYLGRGVSIGEHCYIAEGVQVGAGSRIGNGVSLWRGVTVGRRVFIAPHVCFVNDRWPKVAKKKWEPEETIIGNDVSIGAGAVVLPVKIGKGAIIGAGAVVTRDVEPGEKWMGIPARMVERGESIKETDRGT